MKRTLKYFCCLLLIAAVSSCKKFLDVRPDDSNGVNPRTVQDFEEMLNLNTLATPNYFVADLFSDDLALSDKVLEAGKNAFYVNAYLWADAVWTPTDNDPIYNASYQCILQMNIILDNIGKAEEDLIERKAIVTAQAKINRAYYYLQLVNLYGNDYQVTTAAKDLAVPLVLHPDPNALPARNTVQEIYNQILQDLNEALDVPALPDFGVDVIHPGRVAAFALLARAYLYMGNYGAALTAATAALQIRSSVLDHRSFTFLVPGLPIYGIGNKPFSLSEQNRNPEVLFAKVWLDADFYGKYKETFYLSADLMSLLGSNDLRYVYQYTYSRYIPYNISTLPFNYSIGVPEMMLIKAECLARKGQGTEALSLINELRKFRFSIADYRPLSMSPSADALTLVLQERRKELSLHGGLRLFDLKRLNKETAFKKDLERRSLSNGSLKATLKAGSARYLMPFAPKIIANNRSIIQNER